MRRKIYLVVSAGFVVLFATTALAENRNFNFLSPSFGGNPLNGTYLFGIAQAQLDATNREVVSGGVGGGGSPVTAGGGTVGGPTIIIPINTNQGNTPIVQAGSAAAGSEAIVKQVN